MTAGAERLFPTTVSGAFISDRAFKECLHACLACQLTSVICAEMGLSRTRGNGERRRSALSLECAGACAKAAQTLLKGVLATDLQTIREHLQACASSCASSAAECPDCAIACRRCEASCRLLIKAIDGTRLENGEHMDPLAIAALSDFSSE
jgi:hypothetical protein